MSLVDGYGVLNRHGRKRLILQVLKNAVWKNSGMPATNAELVVLRITAELFQERYCELAADALASWQR